ncbi:MAG: ATP-binding protein [Bacillota bacterium]|nr:ATP-binding protein [Bacillota bacterium]
MNVGKESEYQENKLSLSQKRKGLISLIAMLNKHHRALVYFGVSDDGEVVGSQLNERSVSELRVEIRDYVKPSIIPEIELLFDEVGNTVIKLEASGWEIPYSAYGEYRIRIGQDDCQIEPQLMRKMLSSAGKDPLGEIASSRQDLHFEGLRRALLLKGVKLGESEYFDKNEGLYNGSGSYNLQAFLLSDENDYSMKVTSFRGIDKSEMLLRNEYGYKSLISSMGEILSYISSLNSTRVVMKGGVREDINLFDYSCFREAFVNACLHSRWQEGTPPNVFVFSDRLVVTSFGGLPYALSEADFFAGRQVVVNRGLQRIFSQLGYVEQTGFGVPYILNALGKSAFEITPNFVNVTIPFRFDIYSKKMFPTRMSAVKKGIMAMIDRDPYVTSKAMAESLDTSLPNVKKNLKELSDKGYIVRLGNNRSGSWNLLHKNDGEDK